jgi:signal transduction histidine kinase
MEKMLSSSFSPYESCKEIQEKIKEQTDNAYKIIENEYKIFRQNRQELKKGIRKLDFFGGRGYVFIIRMNDGVWEIPPKDRGREGKSAYEYKDENGKTPLLELKKQVAANPNGCFVEYKWKNPVSGKVEQKNVICKILCSARLDGWLRRVYGSRGKQAKTKSSRSYPQYAVCKRRLYIYLPK